jgi:hypothetical protein
MVRLALDAIPPGVVTHPPIARVRAGPAGSVKLTDEPLTRGDRRLDTQEVAHSRTPLEFPPLFKTAGDTGIAQPGARPGPPNVG